MDGRSVVPNYRTMKKLSAIALIFLVTVCAIIIWAQAPIQRNNFSTNVSSTPIIGDWRYTRNDSLNLQTNDFNVNSTGITGLQNGGASSMWILYGWSSGNTGSFGWGPGPASLALTNGALIIGVRDTTVIPLRIGGFSSTTANLLSIESNSVPIVTVSSNGTLQASNGVFIAGGYRKQALLVTSTALTDQIDGTLQNSYRWTNMVTNIVLQLTNIIEGQEIDYYFTGGTNTGPNYTVSYTVPNPAGVWIHWGDGITNGPTSFTVTNGTRVAAFTKAWLEFTNGVTTTNLEAYFRYLTK